MVVVITQVKLPRKITLAEAKDRFQVSAQKYLGIPGLFRKYFTISEDGMSATGVYLWKSREMANNLYTKEWLDDQEKRLGAKLDMTWLKCVAVAEGTSNEVISE
jgi:hypothetical protein